MKKRTIISLALTIIFLIILHRLYMISGYMQLKTEILGNISNITAVFNRKDNNEFVKIWEFSKNVNTAEKINNIIMNIDMKKSPKRLKLVIRTPNLDNIVIKLLYIQDEPINISDIDNSKILGAKCEIRNGELVLTPSSNKIEILFNQTLKVRTPIKFDLAPFISLLVILYLFSYKLTSYIADFKTEKHYSRVDIVFLLIFFMLLCIPASHISNAKKASGENRYLASKAKFINNGVLNMKFGKEFNDWFSDRFALRRDLIRLHTIINCTLNKTYCGNNRVTLYKKDNLLYGGSFYSTIEFPGDKNEVLQAYANNVNKLQKRCDDNNIKLYILIVPRKAEFFENPLANQNSYVPDAAEEIIEYLNANTKTNIIYPKELMKTVNKETPVFFKTDHHWTKKGAYVGYTELMKQVKKDFPTVPLLEENSLDKYYDNRVAEHWDSEFNNGQTFRHLGLPKAYAKKILDTPYLYYNNPNKHKLKTDVNIAPIPELGKQGMQDNQFYYPDGLDKKVVVIGNSFAANLVEFLPYSFKYVARYYDNYRYMRLETYEDVFKEYKPDILIINMHTSYIYGLLNLYPNKFRKQEGM